MSHHSSAHFPSASPGLQVPADIPRYTASYSSLQMKNKPLLSSSKPTKSRQVWSIVPQDKQVEKKRPVPVLTDRPNKKFAQLSAEDSAGAAHNAARPKRAPPPFQHPTPRNMPKKKKICVKKIQDMTPFRKKVPKKVLVEDAVYFTKERVAALQRKAELLEDVVREV